MTSESNNRTDQSHRRRRTAVRPVIAAVTVAALRAPLSKALESAFADAATDQLSDTTPGVAAADRLALATGELVEACDGFLAREAIRASLTPAERVEILRGMVLTRATDNRLKAFFSGGEVRYKGVSFQGKGFRSLGQEAIYASAIRLRRGESHRAPDGSWRGDVAAPLIRDFGAALAMHPGPELVRMALNAQVGKAGPPMEGKDLHIGAFDRGILPPTAPLSISSLTIAGMAMAFARFAAAAERGDEVPSRIVRAMRSRPFLVGGTDRFDTVLLEETEGVAIAKVGAEGMHSVAVPQRGLGIAIKVEDGSQRAQHAAVIRLLQFLRVLAEDLPARLAAFARSPVVNTRGETVGELAPIA